MPADASSSPRGHRLSPAALELYAYAVERRSFAAAEATAALGAPADPAITELTSAHLLQRLPDGAADDGGAERWSAVSPRAAAVRSLAPLALRARETHDEMDRLRGLLETLVPAYEAATVQRDLEQADVLELITDPAAIQQLIGQLIASAEQEVLTSHPGGGRPTRVLEQAIGRDESLLGRGVRLRTIYQHTARYSRPTAAYVERIAAKGGQVRTLGDGLMRMILIDRHTGIMAVRDDVAAALVVREPNVVDFMVHAFERSWVEAEPFATTVGPDQARSISDELRQTIVRLLAEGLEDKVIARRLGMSERTCQRHIAEVMRAVGAKSRFQAGFLLSAAASASATASASDTDPLRAPAAASPDGTTGTA
ncbi:LuxR C-terminal-related transcriptional regulator [Streptomyces sp. NPDC060031]|uniref:LuxR C-terminal-related transcriptional regulator n=1 Tax=Streptomyces sp. NPDC060031 TaxID=3347043 RepID=UPI0036CC5676